MAQSSPAVPPISDRGLPGVPEAVARTFVRATGDTSADGTAVFGFVVTETDRDEPDDVVVGSVGKVGLAVGEVIGEAGRRKLGVATISFGESQPVSAPVFKD